MSKNAAPKRIVVTGGSGYLGRITCQHLTRQGHSVRSLDIVQPELAPDGWEVCLADLSSFDQILASLREASAVIHLGASLAEDDWTPILQANIVGAYNVFEAARQCQVARIVYASSHHVSGMYPTTQRLDTLAPTRPDSLYGLSKTFGEQLGQYYWDKYGLESVGLRIGSVRPKPEQTRELFTWLSECDYCRLIDACLTASRVDHTLVWGVSGNGANWWDNAQASHLGFFPRDSADASTVKASDDDAALLRFQGGKRSLHGFSRKVP